jgi:hypothetical protein
MEMGRFYIAIFESMSVFLAIGTLFFRADSCEVTTFTTIETNDSIHIFRALFINFVKGSLPCKNRFRDLVYRI